MRNGTEKLKFLGWYPPNLSPKKDLVLSQVYFLTKEHEMNEQNPQVIIISLFLSYSPSDMVIVRNLSW